MDMKPPYEKKIERAFEAVDEHDVLVPHTTSAMPWDTLVDGLDGPVVVFGAEGHRLNHPEGSRNLGGYIALDAVRLAGVCAQLLVAAAEVGMDKDVINATLSDEVATMMEMWRKERDAAKNN